MMITPSLVVVTKDGTESTKRVFRTAIGVKDKILINNSCCREHIINVRTELRNVRMFDVKGFGLPHSWNMGLMYSVNDWVIISNDDIIFPDNWIETLEKEVKANPDARFFNLAFPGRWGCFMLHKSIIEKVGWFDESFTGIYYEDDDYYLRLKEAGEQIVLIDLCPHSRDLRVIDRKRNNSQPNLTKDVNEKMFFQKWKESDNGIQSKMTGNKKFVRTRPELNPYPFYKFQGE